jgi:dihydrofolate synthase / folylpolyglutamate synthase
LLSTDILDRLKGLHPNAIDLGLDRVRRLLERLGHPEHRLPPVVHVAGTNGKGSVIAFLRAIAEAEGKQVQIYTSPHLVNFHERIFLPGPFGSAPISEEALIDCLARAEKANGGEAITFFEITTAAAFLAFADSFADLLLLETGLGGRLDATNVLTKPAVTAITPVSVDHVSFLGNTISAIASEKAGILKPGVPCILAQQTPEGLRAIEARANEIGAPLHVFGRDFDVFERDRKLVFETSTKTFCLPSPSLKGAHQVHNAGTAIAIADMVLGNLGVDSIRRGLREVNWPARLERLSGGLLHGHVSESTELWLDGGHNVAGAQAIARTLAELDDNPWRRNHLIWGMIDSKDARGVIAAFAGVVEDVYTVTIPGETNAFSADALADIAAAEGFRATAADSVEHALVLSQAALSGPGRVLFFGSLYLAGHVLTLHLSHRNSELLGSFSRAERSQPRNNRSHESHQSDHDFGRSLQTVLGGLGG